jgi:hypothetical protein
MWRSARATAADMLALDIRKERKADKENYERSVAIAKMDCGEEEKVYTVPTALSGTVVSQVLTTLQSARPTYVDQDGPSLIRSIARGQNQTPIIMRERRRSTFSERNLSI